MLTRFSALLAEARWRGVWGTVRALKMNKMGTMHCFVGEDNFKNKYFEDKSETYGRDRWVEYVDDRNPDSLKITPEWHAWLHHNIDDVPAEKPLPKPTYQGPMEGNLTGTSGAYVPSHHRLAKKFKNGATEKYESWTPGAGEREKGGQDVLDLK